ncbi:MAG TPA: tripartite tricarboxylate transporter substrate-binding protein [Burkholderiales bacterium]|nr:tripartite tricarboxylate transporter substrate-binding protein [Burkholderiales bacterium]
MNRSSRNTARLSLAGSLFLALAAAPAAAQAQAGKWPEKPVRIIIASGPGAGDDFVTRLIAPKLAELLGQQFIAENRPGAGGLIGQSSVQKAPPDGYTLLLAGGSMAGARYVNAQVTYDVLRDFTAVSLVETSPFAMVVHPSVPAKNLKEYIALARSQPGRMTYGTAGAGQGPFWSALLFNSMARVQAVEVVYKTIGEGVFDVMGGRIDYFFSPFALAVGNKAKLRVLAVTTLTRSPALPDVPTVAEAALPGYDMPTWRSIMGPAGMRRETVATLNAAIGRALAMPDIREKFAVGGSETAPSTPEELTRRYADWIERFGKIAKEAGVKPQ